MTNPTQPMHAAWEQYSGQTIKALACERILYELWKLEVTPDDIRCVVQGIQRFNRKSSDAKFSMQFHSVCGDVEKFCSMLADFRAKERNLPKPPTPREQMQAVYEQPKCSEPAAATLTARSFKDVMEQMGKNV